MKTIVKTKHMLSILALFIAIVMCLSACGGNEQSQNASKTTNDNSVVDTNDAENDTDVSKLQDDQNESQNSTVSTASKNNTGTASKKPATVSGKAVWDKDYVSSIPASVKQKGIKILLWRDLHKTEQKLLDDFVKKTGCKVTKVITTEKEYSTKLISMITAKDSPDVCVLGTESFPGRVTKSLQPLDEKIFRLDDDCWQKDYMKIYMINGKYFSVAMPGAWNCEDTTFVTYYQPKVLKACAVKTMPYDLWKQGKWNWDTQFEIASKVKAAGKGYVGISLHHYDMFMLSAGEDFISYDGKQFTNALGKVGGNSLLVKAWQAAAKLNENGLSTGWVVDKVRQGKVGLFTTIAYGLYNEGNFGFDEIPGGFESMNVVPVAGPKGSTAYTPTSPKTWGVPKGAKNVEGAAYFLRYWLDTSNCDMDSTFINKQAKEVFEIVTKKSHKKKIRVGIGAANYVTTGTYENICYVLNQTTAANITTSLNKYKGTIDSSIKKANRDIARIK